MEGCTESCHNAGKEDCERPCTKFCTKTFCPEGTALVTEESNKQVECPPKGCMEGCTESCHETGNTDCEKTCTKFCTETFCPEGTALVTEESNKQAECPPKGCMKGCTESCHETGNTDCEKTCTKFCTETFCP